MGDFLRTRPGPRALGNGLSRFGNGELNADACGTMKSEIRLWLVVLTTRDHVGDTAAIASVFSGRGIQIDSFIGFGGNPQASGESQGRIMITFHAFEERSRALCRVLDSLEAVAEVRCFAEVDIPPQLMLQALAVKRLLAELKG